MGKTGKSRRIRKIITAAVIILIAGTVVLIQFVPSTLSSKCSLFGSHQYQIAHRGLSSMYPESSADAYEAAGAAGFYGAECDVHTTKDGVLVIMHDDTVDRTTNGEGEIKDLTYNEIEALEIDTGNGIDRCVNRKVITLAEYLRICAEYDMVPYIEIKNFDTSYLSELFSEVEQAGLSDECVLISFSVDYLIEARSTDRSMKMMLISNTLTKDDVDECIRYGFGIDFDFLKLCTYFSAVNYAEENGVELASWTVDFPIISDFLHLIGCDYITTNRLKP